MKLRTDYVSVRNVHYSRGDGCIYIYHTAVGTIYLISFPCTYLKLQQLIIRYAYQLKVQGLVQIILWSGCH
jgi:hypothetical protein